MHLVFPMFAMVLLTFFVLIKMFRTRLRLVRERKIDLSFYSIYQGEGEPEQSAKLARHFTNLFEAPVLFYVCCLSALAVNVTGLPFIVLAWAYVAARLMHAIIHTGSNRLRLRIYAYFSSWLILLSMWLLLVFKVAFSL